MKKLLLLAIVFVGGCTGYGGYGGYSGGSSISDFYDSPLYESYSNPLPKRRTSSLYELDKMKERERTERRLNKLERFRSGWMERNSPYGRSLLTGRRPSYGESLLK